MSKKGCECGEGAWRDESSWDEVLMGSLVSLKCKRVGLSSSVIEMEERFNTAEYSCLENKK